MFKIRKKAARMNSVEAFVSSCMCMLAVCSCTCTCECTCTGSSASAGTFDMGYATDRSGNYTAPYNRLNSMQAVDVRGS